jgi:uncharacterized protein (TIGR03086 family)
MSTPSQRFRTVADDFASLIAAVDDDAWSNPSPCPGWTACDVVGHLVDWLAGPGFLLGAFDIETGPLPPVADDPGAAWATVSTAIQAGLDDPDTARRVADCGPLGSLSFERAVEMTCIPDVLIHTWDLARAAGVDVVLNEHEIARQADGIASLPDEVDAAMRGSGQFGPRVEVDDDADAVTAVLGFFGRDAGWQRSASRPALPPAVDADTWRRELDDLHRREKAATRELDAIAAARRRLPMVELDDYTLVGEDGQPVRLVDIFDGKRQLITYHHMWSPGADWQCPGCTGFTSQYTRLEFLDGYDARFVVVTPGPIDEALAYKRRVGNRMTWYSSADSAFAADMDAPLGGGFQVNVFLRDGDRVYRTYNTQGRGTEQLGHTFGLLDLLPYGRQEEWQDSPAGWPQAPTYSNWPSSEEFAIYGER